MAANLLSDFHPFVMPYAPGALAPSVDQALRLATVEFCERTRAWRYETTLTTTIGGDAIIVPDYASIHEIESAHFDKIKLIPMRFSDISQSDAANGQPEYFTQINAGTVRVIPFKAGTLSLALYLKPLVGLTLPAPAGGYNRVPDFIYEQHAQIIGHGALSRILMLPKQSYSNPSLAAQFRSAFNSACDELYHRNMRGQHRARTRTKPVFL